MNEFEYVVIGIDPDDDNRAIVLTGCVFECHAHALDYAGSCHARYHATAVPRPRLNLGPRYPWSETLTASQHHYGRE